MPESRILDGFRGDVRCTLRTIRRHPGFYGAVILTLALGIAANTAIFSIYNALLLKPLPYPEPDRLVMVLEKDLRNGDTGSVTPADFVDWRQRSRAFAHLSALILACVGIYGVMAQTVAGRAREFGFASRWARHPAM